MKREYREKQQQLDALRLESAKLENARSLTTFQIEDVDKNNLATTIEIPEIDRIQNDIEEIKKSLKIRLEREMSSRPREDYNLYSRKKSHRGEFLGPEFEDEKQELEAKKQALLRDLEILERDQKSYPNDQEK